MNSVQVVDFHFKIYFKLKFMFDSANKRPFSYLFNFTLAEVASNSNAREVIINHHIIM